MRIGYVAKHDSGGNDDEGAITHALMELGHNVQRLQETMGHRLPQLGNLDLVLFHKWDDPQTLAQFKCPRIFWYFDLVDHLDPMIADRCRQRRAWMHRIIPHVDIGFCTDGDWVDRDETGKLVLLRQGADERVVSRVVERTDQREQFIDVLFTGVRRGGAQRESFVDELKDTYGQRLRHVTHGIHGKDLAFLIACSKVVVAPDSPVTDRYWSNRVYNACGFGAFMVHPECADLCLEYSTDELPMYGSRDGLHHQISYYLEQDDLRHRVSEAALKRTVTDHLYRHRVADMLRVVKERTGVS